MRAFKLSIDHAHFVILVGYEIGAFPGVNRSDLEPSLLTVYVRHLVLEVSGLECHDICTGEHNYFIRTSIIYVLDILYAWDSVELGFEMELNDDIFNSIMHGDDQLQ